MAAIANCNALAADVTVAVASNFAGPIRQLATGFERETGHRMVFSVGATGQFYAQIVQGAPFAVLLSADDETPRKLATEGHALASSQFTYAVGRLALWRRTKSGTGQELPGAEILRENSFKRLAVADPGLSPYGAAAMEVLRALGIEKTVKPKIVEGANITQAYQFVATGNADLGFVAYSQISQDGQIVSGEAWLVPDNLHTPLKQDAIILKSGQNNPAAIALMSYLKTEKVRQRIRTWGYETE